MLHYLRQIRQKLIIQENVRKYLLYAFGEILLVVIGILIALQVNNWNEERNDRKLEQRYMSDLIQDIRQDSMNIELILTDLEEQIRTKEPLIEMIKNSSGDPDSVLVYFRKNWININYFSPNKATFDEMTNSSNLDIIQNTNLRRSVIELYAEYNSLLKLEESSQSVGLYMVRLLKANVPNLDDPKVEDIYALKNNDEIVNSISLNFTSTRFQNYLNLQQSCTGVLRTLRNELVK